MNPREYHKDVFLPPSLLAAVATLDFSLLHYSRHARLAALEDCVQVHELPRSLALSDWTVVKVETIAGRVSGLLIRRPRTADPRLHIVLAIAAPDMVVRTVWINRASDNHRTLDRKKYVPAP
jgi:hypothetical protein